MANEIFKEIKTRIALKTLNLAGWEAIKDTYKPLKGEVCVCEISTGNNVPTANSVTPPTVLFKVGDGEHVWSQLNWASALAADVYSWAKAENVVLENEHVLFKDATGKTIKDLDLSTFATDGDLEEIGRELAQLESLVHGPQETLNTTAQTAFGGINEVYGRLGDVDTLATNNTDTVVDGVNEVVGNIGSLSNLNTTNKSNLVNAINEALQAVETGGTGSVVTLVKEDKNTHDEYTLKQGGKAVGDKIVVGKNSLTMKAGNGLSATETTFSANGTNAPIFEVSHGNTSDATNLVANGRKYVTGLTFDDYGHVTGYTTGEEVDQDLSNHYTKNETYNKTEVDNLVQGAKDYADNNDANTEYHVEYDSANKKIKLVAGADASKMEIDATAFIKDGMIESVELVQEDASGNKGQFLKLTWNDDGKDVTYVPVGELVDVYTGSNGDEVNVAISNTNVVSASLNSTVATKIAHGEEAHGWGNHASQGYLKAGDIAGKANTADLGALAGKDKIVEGDIEGTIAVGKISGLGALATKDNITHELVTDFDAAVAAIKVANADNADYADNAQAADYATEAGDAEKLGGQLPSYYATKESVDAIPDAIDSKISAYDAGKGFGDIITHNVAEFATAEQGEKADTALQSVEADTGLKIVEGTVNKVAIDTDVVFILDCNW